MCRCYLNFHIFFWLFMHLSMLSRWGRRPGIGGGFDSSHRPVVGTFDCFNDVTSSIALGWGIWTETLSAVQMPRLCPSSPPPPPPQQLNINRCITLTDCWRPQHPILCNSEKAKSVGCKMEDMGSRLCFLYPGIPGTTDTTDKLFTVFFTRWGVKFDCRLKISVRYVR